MNPRSVWAIKTSGALRHARFLLPRKYGGVSLVGNPLETKLTARTVSSLRSEGLLRLTRPRTGQLHCAIPVNHREYSHPDGNAVIFSR